MKERRAREEGEAQVKKEELLLIRGDLSRIAEVVSAETGEEVSRATCSYHFKNINTRSTSMTGALIKELILKKSKQNRAAVKKKAAQIHV